MTKKHWNILKSALMAIMATAAPAASGFPDPIGSRGETVCKGPEPGWAWGKLYRRSDGTPGVLCLVVTNDGAMDERFPVLVETVALVGQEWIAQEKLVDRMTSTTAPLVMAEALSSDSSAFPTTAAPLTDTREMLVLRDDWRIEEVELPFIWGTNGPSWVYVERSIDGPCAIWQAHMAQPGDQVVTDCTPDGIVAQAPRVRLAGVFMNGTVPWILWSSQPKASRMDGRTAQAWVSIPDGNEWRASPLGGLGYLTQSLRTSDGTIWAIGWDERHSRACALDPTTLSCTIFGSWPLETLATVVIGDTQEFVVVAASQRKYRGGSHGSVHLVSKDGVEVLRRFRLKHEESIDSVAWFDGIGLCFAGGRLSQVWVRCWP